MNKRRMVAPGHRLVVGMVAVALAVMFAGLGTRGASASQLEACPTVPDGTAGQKQAGTANTATGGEAKIVVIDQNGQLVPVNEEQFCISTATGAGDASAGFAEQGVPTAPTSGTTCTIPLPEGAVPGTVLVVTVQGTGDAPANTGGSATSCAVSTISPAVTTDPNATSGGVSSTVAGEACAVSSFTPADQDTQSAPSNAKPGPQAAPAGTAEAGASADAQTAFVEGDAQQQRCDVVVLDPAPGAGVGGTTSGAAASGGTASTEGAPVCIVSDEGGATAGSAAGGANTRQAPDGAVVVNGQVVVCADVEPGTVKPVEPATSDATPAEPGTVKPVEPTTSGAAPAEIDASFTCVVQDSQNPNVLVCTKQP